MAIKKDEADEAQRAGRSAEEAGRDLGRTAEDATQQMAGLGRRATEQTADIADRGLRQAADMMRQRGQDMGKLFAVPGQAYQDLTEYSKADVEALVQSSTRLARGLQEMGWEVSQFTQESVRLGLQLTNELLECRSVEDLVARQRDFIKESVDIVLSRSARLLSLSSRVANDAVTPINQRIGGEGGEGSERSRENRSSRGSSPQ